MKRAWFVLLVALLAAMICNAALAEGLQGDGDRTGEQAVAARAVELPVAEVSEAPLPESGNDMVSERRDHPSLIPNPIRKVALI